MAPLPCHTPHAAVASLFILYIYINNTQKKRKKYQKANPSTFIYVRSSNKQKNGTKKSKKKKNIEKKMRIVFNEMLQQWTNK